MRSFWFALFILHAFIAAPAQTNIAEAYSFNKYLLGNRLYKDAAVQLSVIDSSFLSADARDTLRYMSGKVHFYAGNPDTALEYFSGLRNDLLQRAAIYYNGIMIAESGYSPISEFTLRTFSVDTEDELYAFHNLQHSGMALMGRDLALFDSLAGTFRYDDPVLSPLEKDLTDIRSALSRSPNRSPALAGVLSAMVPGAGKIYAGRAGSGLGTFFMCATFAAIAAEIYMREERFTAPFYLAAGTFAVFYAANIGGSVIAVKVQRKETYERINHHILVDLKLPLGSFLP